MMMAKIVATIRPQSTGKNTFRTASKIDTRANAATAAKAPAYVRPILILVYCSSPREMVRVKNSVVYNVFMCQ